MIISLEPRYNFSTFRKECAKAMARPHSESGPLVFFGDGEANTTKNSGVVLVCKKFLVLLQRFCGPTEKRWTRRLMLILAPWQVEGNTDYARFHHLNDQVREICETTDMRILDYSKLYRQ